MRFPKILSELRFPEQKKAVLLSMLVTINNIIAQLMPIAILAVPLGIFAAILLWFDSKGDADIARKQQKRRWIKFCLAIPLAALFLLVLAFGFVHVLENTYA